MARYLWNATRLFVLLSLLTGLFYPLAMTGLLPALFPEQAGGSLVRRESGVAGSALLAQKFSGPGYFWPRPSAAEYATVASGASNLGPTSAALKAAVRERSARLRLAHNLPSHAPVPPELIFASASGLDPHLSPEAAYFQLERVARARAFNPVQTRRCRELIGRLTEKPQFGIFGPARINVLLLNLELDALQ